jgi:F-type H+-transporting ATPase subunit a
VIRTKLSRIVENLTARSRVPVRRLSLFSNKSITEMPLIDCKAVQRSNHAIERSPGCRNLDQSNLCPQMDFALAERQISKSRVETINKYCARVLSWIPGTLLRLAAIVALAAGFLTAATPGQEEHQLSQQAVEIARPFGFPITNSMVVTWIVAVALIIFARIATRDMKRVPEGAQNLLEWLVGGLYGFLEGVIGSHLVKRTFWFFATIFIFILAANWISLIPGVGTIGWGHQTPNGFKIDEPLFRGANADLNLTFAMALVFFALWIVWALQEIGPVGFLKELFAPKGETAGLMKVLMVVVFFAVGCLEIISILFRPVSLSFRLYGNVFAGENMLEAMSTLVPGFGWLLPIPFYFLELLVGLVQALVFMLLTAVFTLLICQHEEESPAAAPGTEV